METGAAPMTTAPMTTVQLPPCPVCDGDGWYADARFVDGAKRLVIRKVACPRGCRNRDNEPGVLPTARPQ
jgi:hypothetical protein